MRSGVTARILAAVRVEKVSPPPPASAVIFTTNADEYRQSSACSQRVASQFLNTCGTIGALTANFLERARDADHGVDAVLRVLDARNGLLIGHRGSDD